MLFASVLYGMKEAATKVIVLHWLQELAVI